MNILVINWQDWKNPLAGGAEVYLYEIFSRLIKKGHRVVLLVSRAKTQPRHELLDGFDIYRIGKRSTFNFFIFSALRALLRHNDIDIVIDDLNKIPFYSPLFTNKKVIAMLMHLFRTAIYRETNFIFASYVFFTERIIPYLYPHSTFVAISNSTADDLRKIGVRNDIVVVHSGIPEIPSDITQERQKNLVAYVGRVKMYKSIDHFIRAIALIKEKRDIEAVIVGDGDAKKYLMNLARTLNVNITFTGFVSEREKYRIYSSARVVVQPSIKEGWGLTAIEAQSRGTPVVCADSPGLREVVADGESGFLYPYGDIDTLAARITKLVDDDAQWQHCSQMAYTWARRFSWDKAAEKLERLLLSSVGHQGHSVYG
jgi:glycosyltransferase involved in cell wall biosynthesis